MYNPLRLIAGYVGGRTFSDLKNDQLDCSSSEIIGGACLLSVFFISVGYLQFIRSMPALDGYHYLIWIIATFFLFFLFFIFIRAGERSNQPTVLNIIFSLILFCSSFFTSSEWLILIFKDQTNLQILSQQEQGKNDYVELIKNQNNYQEIISKISSKDQELANILNNQGAVSPQALALQDNLKNCNSQADYILQSLIQKGLSSSQTYRRKTNECNIINQKLQSTFSQVNNNNNNHLESIKTEINELKNKKIQIEKLSMPSEDTIILINSAQSDTIGRHSAVWKAIYEDKIPKFSAIIVFLFIFMLEFLVCLIKFFSVKDAAMLQNELNRLDKNFETQGYIDAYKCLYKRMQRDQSISDELHDSAKRNRNLSMKIRLNPFMKEKTENQDSTKKGNSDDV